MLATLASRMVASNSSSRSIAAAAAPEPVELIFRDDVAQLRADLLGYRGRRALGLRPRVHGGE